MSDELITVATFPNAFEAHVAKNYLDENGIASFIAGENASNLQYPALLETKLLVAEMDAERATTLLKETGAS